MRALARLLVAAVAMLGASFLASALRAEPVRIGVLSLHSSDQERATRTGATAFRAGMDALGYRVGENIAVYERHADGDRARLQALAYELLRAQVQVIVAVGTDATEAAREATSSTPIVMAGVSDPLASGLWE
jgi:putative ABC transport system substrate-binding protein